MLPKITLQGKIWAHIFARLVTRIESHNFYLFKFLNFLLSLKGQYHQDS